MSFTSNKLLKIGNKPPLTWTKATIQGANLDFATMSYSNANLLTAGGSDFNARFLAIGAIFGVTQLFFSAGNADGRNSSSPDGWLFDPKLDTNYYWSCIAFGQDKYVALANGVSSYGSSPYGTAWSSVTPIPSGDYRYIVYGNNKFVALDINASAIYSNDGINWTLSPNASSVIPAACTSLAYGNGKFVATSYNANKIAYSSDGISWSTTNFPNYYYFNSVTYGNGKFIIAGKNASNQSLLVYSNDGISWTFLTSVQNSPTDAISFGNGRFVGNGGGVYSDDGITWKISTGIPSTSASYRAVYGQNRFVNIFYTISGAQRIEAYYSNVC